MSTTAPQIDRAAALVVLDEHILERVECLDEVELEELVALQRMGATRANLTNHRDITDDDIRVLRTSVEWVGSRVYDEQIAGDSYYAPRKDMLRAALVKIERELGAER